MSIGHREDASVAVDDTRGAVDVGAKVRRRAAQTDVGAKPELVHAPNAFPRTALFKAMDSRSKRDVHASFIEVASSRNLEVWFKGPDLHIFDFLVWTQIAKLVRNTATKSPDGITTYRPISLTIRSLCLHVGLPVNGHSYDRLQSSLEALWDVDLKLIQYSANKKRPARTIERVRMMSGFGIREEKRGSTSGWEAQDIRIQIDSAIFELFVPGHYCALDARALKSLIKSPLAAWLYAHLASHSDFSKGMRYDTLQRLAGLEHLPLKEARRVTRAAIGALERQGHVANVDVSGTEVFKLRPLIQEALTRPDAKSAVKKASVRRHVPVPVASPRCGRIKPALKAAPKDGLEKKACGTDEKGAERVGEQAIWLEGQEPLAFNEFIASDGTINTHLLDLYTKEQLWHCSLQFQRDHADEPQYRRAYNAIRAEILRLSNC